jgi:hypothetical protein
MHLTATSTFPPSMFTLTEHNPYNLPQFFCPDSSETSSSYRHTQSAEFYLKEVWNLIMSYCIIMETHQIDFLVICCLWSIVTLLPQNTYRSSKRFKTMHPHFFCYISSSV